MSITLIGSACTSKMVKATKSSYFNNTDYENSANNISTNSYSVSSNIRTISDFVQKYDVTNMSANEMIEMSENLYKEGVISLRTSGVLIMNALSKEDISGNTSRNFVSELEDSLEQKITSGAKSSAIESTKEALSFLENMRFLNKNAI